MTEGGGGGYSPAIIDVSAQDDGSYIVKFTTHEENNEYESDYAILEAFARLKEVDGKSAWSV